MSGNKCYQKRSVHPKNVPCVRKTSGKLQYSAGEIMSQRPEYCNFFGHFSDARDVFRMHPDVFDNNFRTFFFIERDI